MKGTAWAGYHGNRCTLHSMGAAVGFFGAESSSPSLGLITSLSLMECSPFSYLCPLLSRPPIHSVAWPHYPAKIVPSKQQSTMTLTAVTAYPHTQDERMLRSSFGGSETLWLRGWSWSYVNVAVKAWYDWINVGYDHLLHIHSQTRLQQWHAAENHKRWRVGKKLRI